MDPNSTAQREEVEVDEYGEPVEHVPPAASSSTPVQGQEFLSMPDSSTLGETEKRRRHDEDEYGQHCNTAEEEWDGSSDSELDDSMANMSCPSKRQRTRSVEYLDTIQVHVLQYGTGRC